MIHKKIAMQRVLLFFLSSCLVLMCCTSCGDDFLQGNPNDCSEKFLEYSEYQHIIQSLYTVSRNKESNGPELNENESVPLDDYAWIFYYEEELFARNLPNGEGDLISLEQETYYCIPHDDESYWLEEELWVENIIVQTKFDFNDDYSAGDDIEDLVYLWLESDLDEHLSLPATDRPASTLYNYKIKEKPTAGESFAPIVTVQLSDGTEFSAEGTTVTIE